MKPLAFVSVLLLARCVFAADSINVGEEFVVMPTGPGGNVQATPSVAFGSKTYLVTWREGWLGKGGDARIYAARVSGDGKVLDPNGIAVTAAKVASQERPRVAFGGGVFLVVWQDFRNGHDFDILAARISPEGQVLDSDPINIAVGPRTQALPDVASDGTQFLVVWQGLQDTEAGYRGFAATVSNSGKVGPVVETGATPQPRIAWNGARYLVAYGIQAVHSVMLSPDGKPLNASPWGNQTIRSTKDACFSVSGVPSKGWLVVGHRSPPDPWGWGGPGAMRAAFVNADGRLENDDAVKEPSGVQSKLPGWLDLGRVKNKDATWPFGSSTSAWDGKQSVVVWQRHHLCGEKFTNFENCDLIASRVDGFRPQDEAGVPVATSEAEERQPSLASNAAGHLFCVYERRGKDGKVRVVGRMLQTN